LAGAIAALGGSWLAVPALPVALAAALGCGLGGLASARPSRATRRAALGFGALYLVVAGLALGRPLAAQAAYAAALHAPGVERRLEELDRAVRLDPQFPLYRARRAWIGPEDARTRAYQALVAARDSLGVAPLWLRAGSMALAAGEQAAAHQAFERAMAFDPLGADAPFLLFITSAGGEVDCAARSMLADPRLAAAAFWRGREAVRRRAIDVVSRWDGVDAGWREAFVRQATRLSFVSHDEVDLVSRIDEEPALSASLHLFRRPGAPQELTRIRLVRPALDAVGLPSAAALATSKPAAFPKETCAPR